MSEAPAPDEPAPDEPAPDEARPATPPAAAEAQPSSSAAPRASSEDDLESGDFARGARLLIGFLVLGLAVKGVLSLVPVPERTPQISPPEPAQVRVLRLQEEAIVSEEERYARLQPAQEWTLALEVGGRIATRPVANGQECAPRDLLFALDPAPFEAEVLAAEARLRRATSGLRLAEAELERVKALAASTATQRDLDAAQAERDQAQAQLAEAEALLTQARHRRTNARLAAPARGIVSGLTAEVGAVVAPGQPLGSFARRDVLLAKVLVSAEVRHGLVVGQQAQLVTDRERSYTATLARAAAVPAGKSGQFEVEFEVGNAAGELLPGEPVRIRFQHGQALRRLRVPRSSVYEEYGLWRALVPPGERPATFSAGSVPIVIGPGDPLAGWVSIHSGLAAGDEVLVPGRVTTVREGQTVRAGEAAAAWLPPYAR